MNGEDASQAVRNGKAVMSTDSKSTEPSLEWEDLPMAANRVRLMVSTIARRGRSSGVYTDTAASMLSSWSLFLAVRMVVAFLDELCT